MLRGLCTTVVLVGLTLAASAQPWRRFFSSFDDPQALTPNSYGIIEPAKDGGAYEAAAALTKYGPDGKQEWTTPYLPIGVQGIHEGGNAVYVLGSDANGQMLVKFDLTGKYLFSRNVAPPPAPDTGDPQFAVDSSDNVYVSESSILYRIDASGNSVWRVPSLLTSPGIPIRTDTLGNLILEGVDGMNIPYIEKVNASGQVIWQKPEPSDVAFTLGSDDAVYICCRQATSVIQKVTPSGALVWSQPIVSNVTTSITPNSDGTTYVFGTNAAINANYWIGISPTGALLWTRQKPFPLVGDGQGNAVMYAGVLADEFNSSAVLLGTYNMATVLGVDASTIGHIVPANGCFYCSVGAVGDGRTPPQPSYSGAAKIRMSGAVAWSNLLTTNWDTQVQYVKGCVTPGGTTFLAGEVKVASTVAEDYVEGFDPNGKLIFSNPAGEGGPSKMMPESDGGFLLGTGGGIARYDATGHQLWNTVAGSSDFAIDSLGNVLAIQNGVITKLSPAGQVVWTYDVHDTSIEACAIGASNSVFAAGSAGEKVWSVTSAGALNFAKSYVDTAPPDTKLPTEVCTDAAGNAYVTYNLFSTGSTQGSLRKVSPSGVQIWTSQLAYSINSPVVQTVLDPGGTLYSVGQTVTAGIPLIDVFSVQASSGSGNWAKQYKVGDFCAPSDVQLGKEGDVFVGGWCVGHGTQLDRVVLELDPSGNVLQTIADDSGYKLDDNLGGFALDKNGNAYVFGDSPGPNLAEQFQVNKYGPPVPLDATVVQTAQATMVAGLSYIIPVSATNSGSSVWTAATGYKLDCLEPGSWGVASAPLSPNDSIGYGVAKAFLVTVVAPATPGTYPIQWRMEQSGVQFGTPSNVVNVNVVAQTNFASFVSQTVATSMISGQTYPVSLQFMNTGANTWTSGLGYDLVAVNPGGNMNWGRNRLPLVNGPVVPGGTAIYSGNVIAPASGGLFNFEWQPIQEGVSAYGPFSPNVQISVTKASDAARFISQSGVPTTIQAGTAFSPTINFMNVGTNPWTLGTYVLRSRNPYNNSNWGPSSISLPGSVGPGGTAAFKANLIAPAAPGTYNFQWSMMNTGTGTLFGDLPVNVRITVTPVINSATFVSQSAIPTVLGPGNSFTASLTFKNVGSATWDSTYALASRNPDLNKNWGVASLPVAGTVVSGTSTTFTHSFTTPVTPGTYHFAWAMYSGAMFGQQSPDVTIVISADCAQYISDSDPVSINAGTDFYIENTMLNNGTTTWSSGTGYSMMSINPANNVTWGRARNYLSGLGTFAPGVQTAIYGLCTAPTTPGVYLMQWQMNRNGVPFGVPTPPKMITVSNGPDDAIYISETVLPGSFVPNHPFPFTFVMKNLGTATWDSSYTLVPISPVSFGVTSIPATTTAPGGTCSFTTTLTTPSTPGNYAIQWRMKHNGVLFGQATVYVVLTVASQ